MKKVEKSWIDICYPDYNKSYDKIFYNKLAFQQVENGDLAIDLEEENYGKVIYLSHDGSDLHGYSNGKFILRIFGRVYKNRL